MGTTKTTWDPDLTGDDTDEGFRLNGRYFPVIRGGAEKDDDADDGDDSTEGDNDSGGSSTDDDDEDDGSKGGDDKGGEQKTLTQKQVDEIVAREKSKATRGKLDPKSLGFKDAAEAKAFVDTMRKKADEDKSEGEKALEEAITEAKTEAKAEVLDQANERLTRAEFIVEAREHNVAYREDAYEIAQKLDIWDDVEIDDKGNVTGFDDDFFTELEKQKPYLFGKEEDDDSGGSDIGAGRRRKKGDKTDREAELKKTYPALQANG